VSSFTHRVIVVVGVVVVAALALYLLAVGLDVLLLAFAGVLLALFLRSFGRGVSRVTGLGDDAALGVVIALLLALTGLGCWLIAPAVVEQAGQLLQQVPEAAAQIRDAMERTSWGRTILPYVPSTERLLQVERPVRAGSTVLATLGWAAGGAASIALVLFIGLYVAATPEPYRRGVLWLVPPARRPRARRVLDAIIYTLQRWLVGKVVGMVLIGSLTGIGLTLLGIPLALALGVLAGLLNFVPYVGPLMSFLPAALLGATRGPVTVLWVLGLYLVIQGLESYVVTPLIQQQAVALPPALLITAQVLLGVTVGWLGLLLATPITVVVVGLVRELYMGKERQAAAPEKGSEEQAA
jgi:predicted PurR-regulated permease PerM